MGKISLIASLGILALSLVGCNQLPFGGTENTQPTAEQPAPGAKVATPPAEPQKKDLAFEKPTQPGKVTTAPVATGLIPPYNQDKRVDQILKGRTDPFNVIPVVPIISKKFDESARTVSQVTPIPQGQKPTATAPKSVKKTTGTQPKQIPTLPSPGFTTPGGTIPPTPPKFIPELPPLPQPSLAKSVAVTGVIEINGQIHAIVKAPNEKTSRYVKAGQYLSNGQILVKRIEANTGPMPVVILEQYGVEVSRQVGEMPEEMPGSEPTAPTAMLPNSPSSL